MNRPSAVAVMVALTVCTVSAVSACGYVTDPSPDPTTSQQPVSAEPTTPSDPPSPTGTAPTPPAESELPGEPLDGYPEAGSDLTIIGVPAAEILNLRIGPGVDYESIARMPPDTPLVATGSNRSRDGAGIWYQVRAGEQVGWVLSQYVAATGASRDITDSFDPLPSAASRADLVDAVVAAWDQTAAPQAVVVYGPVGTDNVQARVNVLTPDDDSVLGTRLFIVAEADDGGYTVTRVTATQLCARGAAGTGECA